jgi:hypothetical protein
MAYNLVQMFYSKDRTKSRKEPLEAFSTLQEALKTACTLLATDNNANLLIEDDKGKVVINELEVRKRCSEIIAL